MQRLTTGPYGEGPGGDAELWLDGGHNPHAARASPRPSPQREARAPRPLALIVGMLANKDSAGFFEALKASGAHVFTVAFDGAAADPEALAAVARGHGLGATGRSLGRGGAGPGAQTRRRPGGDLRLALSGGRGSRRRERDLADIAKRPTVAGPPGA
jgi:hypothetical protein